jgi:hypothetical protein
MKTGTLWWFYNGVIAIFGGLQVLWIALQVTDNANKSWWVVFFPGYIAIGAVLIASFGFSTRHKTVKSVFTYRKLFRYGLIGIAIYTMTMAVIWLDSSNPNWTTFWIVQTIVMAGGSIGAFVLLIYDVVSQRKGWSHFHRKKKMQRGAGRKRWWVIALVGYNLLVLQSLLVTIGVSQDEEGSVWGAYAIPMIILFALGFSFFAIYKTFFQRADVARVWISQRQVVRISMLVFYFISLVLVLVKQSGSSAFTWSTVWIVAAIMALVHTMVFLIMYFICECRIMVQGDGPVPDAKIIPNHSPPIAFVLSDGMDD